MVVADMDMMTMDTEEVTDMIIDTDIIKKNRSFSERFLAEINDLFIIDRFYEAISSSIHI